MNNVSHKKNYKIYVYLSCKIYMFDEIDWKQSAKIKKNLKLNE